MLDGPIIKTSGDIIGMYAKQLQNNSMDQFKDETKHNLKTSLKLGVPHSRTQVELD